MTKYTIPTILIGTVLVAVMFAFMPVEQATAVHTTIQGTQFNNVESIADIDLTTEVNVQCDNDFLVHFAVSADADGDIITIDITDDATDDLTIEFDLTAANGNVNLASGTVAGVAATNVEIDATTGTPNGVITAVCQSGDTISFS